MGQVRRGGRRHKKLKAIDPFYSGPRKLLVDKSVSSPLFFSPMYSSD